MIACNTSASASSRLPPPSARATADEMPPPIAPADSICIIMNPGKTSAMPASASSPSRDTHQVSISPVEACASMTAILGQASRSSVRRDRRFEQAPRTRVEREAACFGRMALVPERAAPRASGHAILRPRYRGTPGDRAYMRLYIECIYAFVQNASHVFSECGYDARTR